MEKKRELKEITLKAKLMKLEPKIELAKQYDEYVNNKPHIPEPEPEQIMYIPKPAKQKQKKIIYKEVEEEEEEEEIVYIKKNKPKPQESIEKTLYKSSTEQLHMRAVEERIKHNLTSCYIALMPREYKDLNIGFPRVASITNALNGSWVEYSYNSLNSCSLINALNNG